MLLDCNISNVNLTLQLCFTNKLPSLLLFLKNTGAVILFSTKVYEPRIMANINGSLC